MSLTRVECQTRRRGNQGEIREQLGGIKISYGINLQERLFFRWVVGLHLLDDPLDGQLLGRRRKGVNLFRFQICHNFGSRKHFDEHFFGNLGVRGFYRIDRNFRDCSGGGDFGGGRFRNRGNHRTHRAHDPGGIGDQQLLGLRQQHAFSERPQQGSNFGLDPLRLAASQGKHDTHQFKFSSLVKFFERDPRNQSIGNPFLDIDDQ